MATAPVTPPGVTPLPTPPTTLDPANFDARMDAWLVAQGAFQTQENALAANVYANAQGVKANADEAAASASSAANAAATALAVANFKGTWASQTGALNKPASVLHNGAYWALLNNLGDVTTSQPGVSADWAVVGGAFPVVVISSSTTAAPWKTYLITAPCTLTLPAIAGTGRQIGILVLAGVTGAVIAPAGSDKIRGVAGSMAVDVSPFSPTLTDTGATYGWI